MLEASMAGTQPEDPECMQTGVGHFPRGVNSCLPRREACVGNAGLKTANR